MIDDPKPPVNSKKFIKTPHQILTDLDTIFIFLDDLANIFIIDKNVFS
jgi:hypothetical protein